VSDGRRVRLGVAGLGRAFTLMLPTFLHDSRIELVAACDPREEARAQFARDFDAPVYAGVEALAADPAVEAVYVAPNATRWWRRARLPGCISSSATATASTRPTCARARSWKAAKSAACA
jgi:hypothetical protein